MLRGYSLSSQAIPCSFCLRWLSTLLPEIYTVSWCLVCKYFYDLGAVKYDSLYKLWISRIEIWGWELKEERSVHSLKIRIKGDKKKKIPDCRWLGLIVVHWPLTCVIKVSWWGKVPCLAGRILFTHNPVVIYTAVPFCVKSCHYITFPWLGLSLCLHSGHRKWGANGCIGA